MTKKATLKGRTIAEIAVTLYGEKGAMAALARGLGISPGHLNNIATGERALTQEVAVRLVLLGRAEIEAYARRSAGIEAMLADFHEIRIGDLPAKELGKNKMEADDA